MASSGRQKPYRQKPPEVVVQRIEEIENRTRELFLLQTLGPTLYVVKEGEKKFKVCIGSNQMCTCGDKELCSHILFVMLKVLGVPQSHPVLWQLSLTDSEVDQTLQRRLGGRGAEQEKKDFLKRAGKDAAGAVGAREIEEGDTCPICLADLDDSQQSTHCKRSCGKSVHVKCMIMYAEHAISNNQKGKVPCPFCREDWGAHVLTELRTLQRSSKKKPRQGHRSTACVTCKMAPIKGALHRCVACDAFDLCATCFGSTTHPHSFLRLPSAEAGAEWEAVVKPRGPQPALPQPFMELQNRDLSAADYDTLLQLDAVASQAPPLAQHLVQALRHPTNSPHLQCPYCERDVSDELRSQLVVIPSGDVAHQACVLAALEAAPNGNYRCPDGQPMFRGLCRSEVDHNPTTSSSAGNTKTVQRGSSVRQRGGPANAGGDRGETGPLMIGISGQALSGDALAGGQTSMAAPRGRIHAGPTLAAAGGAHSGGAGMIGGNGSDGTADLVRTPVSASGASLPAAL
ncbi:hypothetical protein CYMTET_44215 [Cymbomonas tetramitiformis]|uniref:E3 ubiquitin-protein ligase Zswim2 n=1 Tax=Cymbomonas tetramitiformis TaxID=36881 RepID=A0AAE0C1X1_9CHLO|nr:hypothetical protein CYMTET_44215 [Cymbomonas tetramitiformis]